MKLPYLKKNSKYILKPFIDKDERRQNQIKSAKLKPRFISDEEKATIEYEELISPKPFYREYDELSFFVEGMARVRVKGKLTYIDYNERQLKLSENYIRLSDFKNGIAEVKKDDGYWYLINKNGVEVNKQAYESILYNNYGFYSAMTSYGQEHLLDIAGNQINLDDLDMPSMNKKVNYFSVSQSLILVSYSDQTYRALDYDGLELFKTKDFTFISDFHHDFAMAVTKEKKVVIIDANLNCLKELQDVNEKEIDGIGFVDGFSIISKRDYQRLINLQGETLCEYPIIGSAGYGLFKVGKSIKNETKYTFLNSLFKEATSFKYNQLNDFSEGIASFEMNNKWGLINIDGNEIVSQEYTKLGACINGFIQASYGDYRDDTYYGKYGFLDKNGKKICPIIYDEVSDFDSNNIAKIKLNGFYGLLNDKGTEITKLQYDSINENIGCCYFVSLGDYRFIIDDTEFHFTEENYQRNPDDNSINIFTDLPF
jgi:hypothetical protein